MTGANKVLHVLMVHFNTPELTSRLVKDFPQRTPSGRAVYIHVLDNSSEPENLRALQDHLVGLDGVTLEVSDRNVGFGEGINLLANRTDIEPSHTLWLLNPDTRLEPGCLARLEDELDAGEFAVVSPLIFSGDGSDTWIWYCGGDISSRELRVRHRPYGSRLDAAPDDAFETQFVTGAAPMMLASTFHAVGGFQHGYFLYWEDVYFSWKAREIGLRLGVVPSAHLWHAVGASSGDGQTRTYYYWSTRNRFTFANDIGTPRRQLISGRGGLESLRPIAKALRESADRWPKTRAAVLGTLDGFRQPPRAR